MKVFLDLETTGLSPSYDDKLSISVTTYRGDKF